MSYFKFILIVLPFSFSAIAADMSYDSDTLVTVFSVEDAIKHIRAGNNVDVSHIWGIHPQNWADLVPIVKLWRDSESSPGNDLPPELALALARNVFLLTPSHNENMTYLHLATVMESMEAIEFCLNSPFMPVLNVLSSSLGYPSAIAVRITDQRIRDSIIDKLKAYPTSQYVAGQYKHLYFFKYFIQSYIRALPDNIADKIQKDSKTQKPVYIQKGQWYKLDQNGERTFTQGNYAIAPLEFIIFGEQGNLNQAPQDINDGIPLLPSGLNDLDRKINNLSSYLTPGVKSSPQRTITTSSFFAPTATAINNNNAHPMTQNNDVGNFPTNHTNNPLSQLSTAEQELLNSIFYDDTIINNNNAAKETEDNCFKLGKRYLIERSPLPKTKIPAPQSASIAADLSYDADTLVTVFTFADAVKHIRAGHNVDVSRLWSSPTQKYYFAKRLLDGWRKSRTSSPFDDSHVFEFTPTYSTGTTALHSAIKKEDFLVIKFLLESPFMPVVNVLTKDGETPVQLASKIKNTELREGIIKELEKYPLYMYRLRKDDSLEYFKSFIVEYIQAFSQQHVDYLYESISSDRKEPHIQKRPWVANRNWIIFSPQITEQKKRDIPSLRISQRSSKSKHDVRDSLQSIDAKEIEIEPRFTDKSSNNFETPIINNNSDSMSLVDEVGNHFGKQTNLVDKSELIELPPAKKKKLSNDNKQSNENHRNCIIDAKYLDLKNIKLELFNRKGEASWLQDAEMLLLKPIIHQNHNLPVHSHAIADSALTLLSTRSLQAVREAKRITFVRNGRGENSLVPEEHDDGRIIFVMPKSQETEARQLVSSRNDVLLIENCFDKEDHELGLAGVRWWAIFTMAYALKLKNYMVMDDNIQSIHSKAAELHSWQNIYDLYQQTANDYDAAIVSSPSFRPHQNDNQLISTRMEAKINQYGYKVFYVDGSKISEKISSVNHIIPPDQTWPLQDIFFQEAVAQAGLTIVKLSLKSLLLKRSQLAKNSTAISYRKRNMNAKVWLAENFNIDKEVPQFYKNACMHMHNLVSSSQRYYENNADYVKRIDFTTADKKKSERVLITRDVVTNENIDFLKTPAKKLLVESLVSLLKKEGFRAPQKKALTNLHKDLESLSINQGYFDMPTGSGKTAIFTELAQAFRDHVAEQSKPSKSPHVLIITPTLELSDQVRAQLLKTTPTIIVDSKNISQRLLFHNDEFQYAKSTPRIVIMCMESLNQLLKQDDSKKIMDKFGLIIVDEMHLGNQDMLEKMKEHSDVTSTLMLGFSATPENTAYFGKRIFYYSVIDAVKDGFLTPWKIKWLKADDFKDYPTTAQTVTSIINKLSHEDGTFNHHGIIWVADTNEADLLVKHLKEKLPDPLKEMVVAYHAKVKDRKNRLKDFKDGKLKVIVAVHTLKEGLDDRMIDFEILAKKTINKKEFIQMRGRAQRVSETNPNKLPKIYVAHGAISKQLTKEEIECPPGLIPAKKVLSRDLYKPVPFPFRTTLYEAICHSMRLIEDAARLNDLVRILNVTNNPHSGITREALRNRENYREHGAPHALYNVYHRLFPANQNVELIEEKPSVHVYIEDNNLTDYKLIQSVRSGNEDKEPLLILKKARELAPNDRFHQFELLRKFGQ